MNEDNVEVDMEVKKDENRFQKSLYFNKLLPYNFDKESEEFLDSIKNNLGRTVAMREINPGFGVYGSKLLM